MVAFGTSTEEFGNPLVITVTTESVLEYREYRKMLPNLRAERARRGMSAEEVGKTIGVCAETYSRWERGERTPSWKYLRLLVALFGRPAEYLMDEEPRFPEPQTNQKGRCHK